MYRALVLALLPALLGAADLTIDHVTVAGQDLKQMRSALDSVGIPSEYGGPHSNHATEMAMVSFPDGSYLELIALQPKPDPQAVAAHYWAKYMNGNAGPAAWAVRAGDLPTEVERLRGTGVKVTAPSKSGRTRPDGTRLEWETAQIGEEPNGTFFPFLIHDFTPREKRASPSGKAAAIGFSGIQMVVIAVHDLDASIGRFQKAYRLPSTTQETDAMAGARIARINGTPVVLAMPVNDSSWVARRLAQFGEGPCAFVLGVAKGGVYRTRGGVASTSTWFGSRISWFDPGKLGWHLGFEEGAVLVDPPPSR